MLFQNYSHFLSSIYAYSESRFSLPIGIYIALLSWRFSSETNTTPVRLMLAREGGAYIQGLRDYLVDVNKESQAFKGKLATLNIMLGSRRHEWRIQECIKSTCRLLNLDPHLIAERNVIMTIFDWKAGHSVYPLDITEDAIECICPPIHNPDRYKKNAATRRGFAVVQG